MNIAIISPPQCSPFTPPLALLALKSYLQAHGVSVTPIDANIDAYHHVLEPERYQQYLAPAIPLLAKGLAEPVQEELLRRRVIDVGDTPPPLDVAHAEAVRRQLEAIWTPEGFSFDRPTYKEQLAAVNDALALMSLRLFPDSLNIWGDNPGISLWKSRSYNPLSHYCRGLLIPQLEQDSPDLIGICLNYADQVFYVHYLITQLRKAGVETPIVIGGAHFSSFCKRADAETSTVVPYEQALAPDNQFDLVGLMLGVFDPATGQETGLAGQAFGIRGEGERALLELCRRIERGDPFDDIPSLVAIDHDRRAIVFNEQQPLLDGEVLPALDLGGMGVGRKYMTPIPMAPIMASRGCYWDKCAFCDHARTLGNTYRELSVGVVADTMEAYRKDFGVEFVFACDESFSPSMLKGLTAKLEQKRLRIPLGIMCRLEEAFLPLIGPAAKVGLCAMSFGFETACERLRDVMNKGYDRRTAEALLDECNRHGVHVLYFVMFGFPSETLAEANQTIDYLAGLHQKLWVIEAFPWALTTNSHVSRHPEAYGVAPTSGQSTTPDPASYTVAEGMSRQEVREVLGSIATHIQLKHILVTQEHEDSRMLRDVAQGLTDWPEPSPR